ncbi:hypothetical protein PF005_g10814 [Phytophthora fragariae]|uniref:Uncharacterized protein n=1 Tax=Phytophthora fragariae TaxID=53985 RepID=A0A6A3Y4A2_9STRA|nr:hypothetical protein PF003_g7028 [Phytophthora fragariae]KAE8938280.1 hypothetical protein PF009_g11830 [Phytophthora fragariae]KAE9092199.1 hypothetical protein PF010_g17895 [Phytophthora fragariae]KAE9113237.1 hypothetical protein PF007_g10795 [Phytophthora fragariae]KAE9143655.1 hypothetical protein PF006_g11339 [Phytophthora fragariae]
MVLVLDVLFVASGLFLLCIASSVSLPAIEEMSSLDGVSAVHGGVFG